MGLIGDWGVHILVPANWTLQLSPESLISVECIKKHSLPLFTFPDELTVKYEFAARGSMPPVTVYWYHHQGGDPYTPPGMTVEEARKIPGKGPQVGPLPAQGGLSAGPGGGSRRGRALAQEERSGYNCIFAGSKGFLGTSGRGEGVGLLPGPRWTEFKLPDPYLARSPGATTGSNHGAHCRDWVRACKVERLLTRISASQGRIPSGCCSARRPSTTRANSFGIPGKPKSPTSRTLTSG